MSDPFDYAAQQKLIESIKARAAATYTRSEDEVMAMTQGHGKGALMALNSDRNVQGIVIAGTPFVEDGQIHFASAVFGAASEEFSKHAVRNSLPLIAHQKMNLRERLALAWQLIFPAPHIKASLLGFKESSEFRDADIQEAARRFAQQQGGASVGPWGKRE